MEYETVCLQLGNLSEATVSRSEYCLQRHRNDDGELFGRLSAVQINQIKIVNKEVLITLGEYETNTFASCLVLNEL